MNVVSVLIGAVTGIISGFGIGGGSLLVLYLTAVQGMAQHTAGAINLLYFVGCAPAALIGHIREKRIEWRATLWCCCAGIATAVPVALFADRLRSDLLRRMFGILLLYVAICEWKTASKSKTATNNE